MRVVRRIVAIFGMMILFLTIFNFHGSTDAINESISVQANPDRTTGLMEPCFIENIGQWDDPVRFICRTGFGFVLFLDDGIILEYVGAEETISIRIEYMGGNSALPMGVSELGYPTNFFIGNDPERWSKGACSFRGVLFENVWPDTDLRYHFKGQDLKYDVLLGPDAEPENVRFRVDGPVSIEVRGDDIVYVRDGNTLFVESGILAYNDEGKPKDANFGINNDGTFGFDVDKEIGETVVIDPIISSNLIVGVMVDSTSDLQVDRNGNTILYGIQMGSTVPITPGAYHTQPGTMDTFVIKIDPNGTAVVFSTVIGGWHSDLAKAMDLDDEGDIYLAGQTYSNDYPTTAGAYQEGFRSNLDIFVTRLDSTGSFLEWSTYVSGEAHDQCDAIKVDGDNVMIGGFTMSHDFITPAGPLGGVHGVAILVVLDRNGTTVTHAAQWDGYEGEYVMGIDVDSNGDPVLCGWTGSPDFPTTPHSVQSYVSGFYTSAFVLKYNLTNRATVFSSRFGSDGGTMASDIAVDDEDGIYFVGTSTNYGTLRYITTPGVVDAVHGGVKEGYLTKVDPNCTRIIYSTLIGGSGDESIEAVEVDHAGNAYLVGQTDSADLIVTEGCYDGSLNGTNDGFVMKLNHNATRLLNSTYLGMAGEEHIFRSTLIGNGVLRILGETTSPDFPITQGAYTLGNVSLGGAFVTTILVQSMPSMVSDLSAREGDACIDLEWNPPLDDGASNITGYHIYRGFTNMSLAHYATVGPVTNFTDRSLDTGVEIFYSVSALNPVGEGPLCEAISNISSTLPAYPVGIKAIPLRYRISISFEPPEFTGGVPLIGYSLYKNGSFLRNLSIKENNFIDMDVGEGITHTYAVTSWNRNGESALSEPVPVRSLIHPSPPRNLTCRSGDGHIDLRWEEPFDNGGTDIDMYMLYRGTSPDDMYAIESIGYDRTSFTDDWLFNGLEYRYFLVAVNEMGWSPPSNTVIDRASTVPDPPSSLHLSLGLGYIDLSWSGPEFDGGSPVSQYVVYRGLEGGPIGLYAVLDGGSSNINVTDPVPNVVHSFRVTAVNMVGESAMSEPVEGTSAGLPSEPLALRAEPGLDGITLEWDPPAQRGSPPLYEYDVFRRSTGSERVRIGSVSGAGRSFTDANVTTGDHYWYSVTATNVHGESRSSVEVLSYTVGPPGPPTEVRVFPSAGRVMVIWQPPQNDGGIFLTGYQVFRIGPYGDSVRLFASNASISSCIDYGAEAGMEYGYYVIAMNEIGRSEPSETVRLMVQGPPGAVDYLNATYISGKVFVIWSAPGSDGGSPISEYRIYRTNGSGPESLLGVVPYHVQRIVDGDVAPGCRYVYRVTAVNPLGEGTSSGSVMIDIPIVSVEGGQNADYTPYLVSALIFLMVLVPVVLLIRRSKVDTPPAPEDIVEYLDWEEE